MDKEIKIGDLIMLKEIYRGHGDKCLILKVHIGLNPDLLQDLI